MPKLTTAQRDLLHDVIRVGTLTCTESYKPAQKLIALGYVAGEKQGYGSLRLSPTDAGRNANLNP